MRLTLLATLLAISEGTIAGGVSTAAGTAEIEYLQNSGWVVVTSRHVLVFDYVPAIDGVDALPEALAPHPSEYGDRRLVVFVTHSHADHFSPSVFEWTATVPAAQFVPGSALPGQPATARVLRPHEDWSSGGLRVRTTGSTDEGVGFLVNVDGISLLHAGDLAQWDASDAAAFQSEIQWLNFQGPSLDLAFFPIATGFACDPRSSIWKGVEDATRTLRPCVLVPMHVRCISDLTLYERFQAEAGPRLDGVQVVAPTRRGEWFRYAAGELREDTDR